MEIFRLKNHDFTPKNHIFFPIIGGRGARRVRPPPESASENVRPVDDAYREDLVLVLHCYKHWEIDIEKVIHSFVMKKKRRLGFLFATRDVIDDQN